MPAVRRKFNWTLLSRVRKELNMGLQTVIEWHANERPQRSVNFAGKPPVPYPQHAKSNDLTDNRTHFARLVILFQ